AVDPHFTSYNNPQEITMDRTEEDMKLVGFFGIFNQSFKTIFSRKKIFTQITLSFILLLAIIIAVHIEISQHVVFRKINNNSLPYNTYDYSREATAIEWLYYALFTCAYLLFLTALSILSTSTVVYNVASVYTGREVVFHNVIKVIPKDLANGKNTVGMGIAVVLYGFLVGAYMGETVVYPRPGEEIQLGHPRVPAEQ
ncbi:hypothetical protein M8C21_018951, partial [Ambrosia artemisiifolia]